MLIKYSKQNNETTNVSLRGVKVECWKALKKLAALEEMLIAEYLDLLVRKEIERLSK